MINSSIDWIALAQESLEELGGKQFYVPGAKLHSHIRAKGIEKGQDFLQYLRGRGVTFRQFMQDAGETISVRVAPPPRTDMLVGFTGAAVRESDPEKRPAKQYREALRFRRDVYGAFTRITPVPYLYDPANDLFTTEPPEDVDCLEVPALALDLLLNERKQFAESFELESVRNELLRSIEKSANPLAAFQKAVLDNGLAARWHQFSYQIVRRRIEAWAQDHKLPVRDEWFMAPRAETLSTPQEILAELAHHMTDEDARNLLVPLRAVEQMYHGYPRRR
ncbi:MAG: hypothetical protein WBD55_04505 [Dehalococcoidia bacterium]